MKRMANWRRSPLMPDFSITPLLHLALVLLLVSMISAPLLKDNASPSSPAAKTAVLEPPAKQPEPPLPVEVTNSTPVTAMRQVSVPGGGKFEVTLTHKPVVLTPSSSAPIADMAAVDQAVLDALVQNWVPPSGPGTGSLARESMMEVVIARDGRVETYALVQPSGHSQADMSVLRAAGLVKRIATPLPAEFSGDRHEVQLHFRAH